MVDIPNAIVLGGTRLPLVEGPNSVRRRNLTQTPPGGLVGINPRPNESGVVNVLSMSNWASIGRRAFRQTEEGVERSWLEDGLDARTPGYLCLGPKANDLGGPSSSRYWYAAFNASNTDGTLYLVPVLGAAVADYVPPRNLTSAGGNPFAALAAINFGVGAGSYACSTWRGNHFWILGPGIPYHYGTDVISATSAGPAAPTGDYFRLLPLDNLMYAFCGPFGAMSQTGWGVYASSNPASGTATWAKVMDFYTMDFTEQIDDIVVGYTGDGFQCFYVLTSRRVYQVDPIAQTQTVCYTFMRPRTHFVGLAKQMVCWERTRSIYVTDEYNIIEITPSVIRDNIGPVIDDGLPNNAGATGHAMSTIVYGLWANQHWLMCTTYGGGSSYSPAVFCYDGRGWHIVNLGNAGETYLNGFSLNGATYVYRAGAASPVLGLWDPPVTIPPWERSGDVLYRSSGKHYIPWFDFEQPNTRKVALEVQLEGFGFSANQTATIDYQIVNAAPTGVNVTGAATDMEANSTWTNLGTTPNNGTFVEGTYRFFFNGGQGTPFQKVRFRATCGSNSGTLTPTITNLALRFVWWPQELWAWDVSLDVSHDYEDKTPQQLIDTITSMIESQQLQPLVIGGDAGFGTKGTRYVRVAGGTGPDFSSGLNPGGQWNLTLFEAISQVA